MPGWEVKNMKYTAIITIAMLVIVAVFAGVANAGSIATISTDKPEYVQGENVVITITNNCRGALTLSGYTVENEKGELIYSPPMLTYTMILQPGACYTDVWMQNDYRGNTVLPGIYIIINEHDDIKIRILGAAEPEVDVLTDKTDYKIGENVMITLTNVGDVATMVNGYWIEDSRGTAVYFPNLPAYMPVLAPGESLVYTWGQTDAEGAQLVPGTYTVCTQMDRTDIALTEVPTVELTTDKAEYESGETVLITFTNVGDYTIPVCSGFMILDSDGEIVYAPMMLAFSPPVAPGETIEYTWDQTDDNGYEVPAGSYIISSVQGNVTIEITAPNQSGNADQANSVHDSVPNTAVPEKMDFTPKPTGLRVRI